MAPRWPRRFGTFLPPIHNDATLEAQLTAIAAYEEERAARSGS